MTVTIREVAKRLNLSITTVSRALDGYDDVADETRERVVRVAGEMGYVPLRAARQLRRRRAEAIGYIMPTSIPRFGDPFFSEFIAGLGDEAASYNLDLMVSLAPADEEAEQSAYQRWVQGRRVDGVILSRMRMDDWRVRYLSAANFPFTTFGRTGQPLDFPHIGVDGRSGVSRLVAHLIERGFRRIAFVSAPNDLTLQVDRFGGYLDGLESAAIPFEENLVAPGDLTHDGGYRAAMRLLDLPERPSAIIGANDLTAIGVMRAAHERGLVVGRDLAVAGFDGIQASEHSMPPLTTLYQPVYDIAGRLVRMLIDLIEGGRHEERQVILQPELVIRASTGGGSVNGILTE